MAPHSRLLISLFAVAVALFAPRGAAGSEVVQLTDANFEHHTQAATGQTAGVWFVKFYAPWCGHCKSLEPDWASLADQLEGKVIVARLESTSNPATTDRFNKYVKSFPTLLLFRDQKLYKFSGARTIEAMAAFATESYAAAAASAIDEVPEEPTFFARHFSVVTRELALGIMAAHDGAEAWMKIMTKDVAGCVAAWKEGGVGGATGKAKEAMSAAPKLYGALLIGFALTGIGCLMAVAVITAPAVKSLKKEREERQQEGKKHD